MRERRLDALAEEIRAHGGCGFEPCETCTHLVPGEGPPDAEVMIVGEAPGRREDLAGQPFVGPAGALLDQLLDSIDLAREDVFITNVLKARPPGNRNPKAGEVAHHRPWLEEQLRLVDPAVVVPMGRHAIDALVPGRKVTEVHGTALAEDGRVFVPLFHPAAALRRRELRETLFADMPAVLAAVGR